MDLTSTPTLFPSIDEQEETQTQEGLVNSFNERELLSLEPVWKRNSAQENSFGIKDSLSTQDLRFSQKAWCVLFLVGCKHCQL